MKRLIKNNLILYFLAAVLLVMGGLAILLTDKKDLHLLMNSTVRPILNPVFELSNMLGEGIVIASILVFSFFLNMRLFLFIGSSYLLASVTTQVLKLVVFAHEQRPSTWFNTNYKDIRLELVNGVELLGENTFPSGHTTAAFSVFLALGIFASRNFVKALCFLLACSVGFARIYMSQHFFEDVYAGAAIGMFYTSVFAFLYYFSKLSSRFNRLDAPLLKVLSAPNKNA